MIVYTVSIIWLLQCTPRGSLGCWVAEKGHVTEKGRIQIFLQIFWLL